MAETLLEDMLDRVRPEVRRCPTDLMVQALRDTIRDFCQWTRAWQIERADAEIVAAQSDYTIYVPGAWAQPITVEYMELDGAPVRFQTVEWLDINISEWRYREGDDFRYFTHITPDKFTFPCVPTANGTANALKYRASYKPSDDSDRVESKLVDEWIEVFSDGAKARLKAMEGEVWANTARANKLEAMYRAGRQKARIRVSRAYGNAEQRWVGPKFGGR